MKPRKRKEDPDRKRARNRAYRQTERGAELNRLAQQRWRDRRNRQVTLTTEELPVPDVAETQRLEREGERYLEALKYHSFNTKLGYAIHHITEPLPRSTVPIGPELRQAVKRSQQQLYQPDHQRRV